MAGGANLGTAALVAVLLLAGCGTTTGHGGAYRIATSAVKSDSFNLARAQGILGGRVNSDGTACLWLGSSALMWPYHYSAGGSPLTVYDDSGNAVAAVVGQHVVFAGGLLPDEVHGLLGCDGFHQFWGVGHVEDPNS